LGDRNQWYRSRTERQFQLRLIELTGMLCTGECAIEDLDDLRRAQLARVVIDLGPAVARTGLVVAGKMYVAVERCRE